MMQRIFLIPKSDDFTQCKIVAFRIYSFFSFFYYFRKATYNFHDFKKTINNL